MSVKGKKRKCHKMMWINFWISLYISSRQWDPARWRHCHSALLGGNVTQALATYLIPLRFIPICNLNQIKCCGCRHFCKETLFNHYSCQLTWPMAMSKVAWVWPRPDGTCTQLMLLERRIMMFMIKEIVMLPIVVPPVKAFAENHSVEGPVKDHPHAHQVLLALHLQTSSCKSANLVLTKWWFYLQVFNLSHIGWLCDLPRICYIGGTRWCWK